MRCEDDGRPGIHSVLDRGHHPACGDLVEVRGGLVEQEQPGSPIDPQQCPGNGDPLAFPCGQFRDRAVQQVVGGGSGADRTSSSRVASPAASSSSAATVPPVNAGRCGTQATVRRHASGSISARSMPPTRTRPESGRTNPSNTASVLDFPEPLGESSRTTSPGRTVKETPSGA